MRITVHLHTILERKNEKGRVNRLEIELPKGSSIEFLLSYLEIELDEKSLLLAVNGKISDTSGILQDGDEVNIMPAISGGKS